MITKLTKKQINSFPKYVEEGLKIGLDTSRIDINKAKKDISLFLKELNLLKNDNPIFILMSNPVQAWIATIYCAILEKNNQIRNQVGNEVENKVRNEVRNQVGNKVRNKVRNEVRNEVRNQVENQIRNQVGNQVWNQVRNEVRNEVRNQVWNQVENQIRNQVGGFVWPYLDGNFYSYYFSFHDFFINETDIFNNFNLKLYNLYKNLSKYSLIYPLNNFIILSEKPTEVHFKDNVLHNDNSPAIKYDDDFSIYCLNGVKVTKEIVETKADKLNPELILKERNAEVRREIVRKIGIERLCEKLKAKVIDSWNDYQLLSLEKIEGKPKYLKMKNPSLENVFHLEGVPSDIETVEQALHFRKPERLKNIPIDNENGLDYYQQGDVIIWPKNAHTVKSFPTILT